MPTYYRIKPRRGTLAQWTSANPVIAANEIVRVTDTNQFKVGDGSSHFNDLPFVTLPNASASASGLMTAAQFAKLSNLTKSTRQTDELIATSAGSVMSGCVRMVIKYTGPQTLYGCDNKYVQAMAINGVLVTPTEYLEMKEGDVVDFIFVDDDKMQMTIPSQAFNGVECKLMFWPDHIVYVQETALDNFTCDELRVLSPTPPAMENAPSGTIITTKVHGTFLADYQGSIWDSITTLDTL